MTAVEWLIDKLIEKPIADINDEYWFGIIGEAKIMEYKQNMNAMQRGMELQKKENNRIGFRERNGLLPSQTEISDEEIEKCNYTFFKDGVYFIADEISFKEGAKWYREQLKNKQ